MVQQNIERKSEIVTVMYFWILATTGDQANKFFPFIILTQFSLLFFPFSFPYTRDLFLERTGGTRLR